MIREQGNIAGWRSGSAAGSYPAGRGFDSLARYNKPDRPQNNGILVGCLIGGTTQRTHVVLYHTGAASLTAYRLATTGNDMEANRTATNPRCSACELGFNAINGVYCPKVGRYVTYAKTPPCETNNGQPNALQPFK